MKRKLSCLILSLVLMFALTGCGGRFLKENEIADYENGEITGKIYIQYYDADGDLRGGEGDPISVSFKLYYQSAPNTVTNFYSLVKAGKYNDTLINKPSGYDTNGIVMGKNYFGFEKDEDGKETDEIDYDSELTVDIGYKIKGEFKKNGWEPKDDTNNKSDVKYGSMYMVLEDSQYDSASIAFGISLDNDKSAGKSNALGNERCVFGEVSTDDVEFWDFVNNSVTNSSIIGTGEKRAKIVKIEIDGDYSMKLIKA